MVGSCLIRHLAHAFFECEKFVYIMFDTYPVSNNPTSIIAILIIPDFDLDLNQAIADHQRFWNNVLLGPWVAYFQTVDRYLSSLTLCTC